jgi:beta-glucosidase
MKQSGGWTLSWQGTGIPDSEFPGATTIGKALADASGDNAMISKDGNYTDKPDVAVVVFGEDPYAEFQGDVPDLIFRDKADNLALLRKYRADGIKTVAVFLSGRPMWVNMHLNVSDAFVAAWLPGSEGGGVADVLFGKVDFKGKLPFSWPKLATQNVLNVGDKNYDPLFAYGYGLSYKNPGRLGRLSEEMGLGVSFDLPAGTMFESGKTGKNLDFYTIENGALLKLKNGIGTNGDSVRSFAVDRNQQEDSRRFVWSEGGVAAVAIAANVPVDLSRETNGAIAIEIDFRVDALGDGAVKLIALAEGLQLIGTGLDVTTQLRSAQGKGWQTLSVPLSCFAKAGMDMSKVKIPLSVNTSANLDLSISRIALGTSNVGMVSCP